MRKEDIIKLRDRYDAIAYRNNVSYQTSGSPIHDWHRRRAEDIAEVCNQALLSSSDHDEVVFYHVILGEFTHRFKICLSYSDGNQALSVIKDFLFRLDHSVQFCTTT